jgi:dihydrofolate reductase
VRHLVVSVLTSLDGYYEGAGHDLSSMPFEDAFDEHNLGLLENADIMIYGRSWFENNLRYWSAIAADPTQKQREHRIAERVTSIDNLVVSDSLRVDAEWPWASRTRVISRAEAPAEIDRLKRSQGGDLLMFGSSTTWNPLFTRGLVDRLIVLVGPGLVGDGAKLYTGAPVGLKLLDARVLPGSQLVAITYDTTDLGAG